MKKLICFIVMLILIFNLTMPAFAAPSPKFNDLYKTDNKNVIITLPADVEIENYNPYLILSSIEGFINFPLQYLIFEDVFLIECIGEVGTVMFTLPTAFNQNEIVFILFTYTDETADHIAVTFAQVDNNGNIIVDLDMLPLNTVVTMYVLHGTIEEIFNS